MSILYINTNKLLFSIIASKKAGLNKGPTLVVAPSSSMMQWQDEAINNTVEGTLKILMFHGDKRGTILPSDILEHDLVLTSYPILEYEYRRCLACIKVKCQYCNKNFLPSKLIVHNQYFCGPDSKRTEKQALREVQEKKEHATKIKAMETLNIIKSTKVEKVKITKNSASTSSKSSFPTPSNIYNELMQKAGRNALPCIHLGKRLNV